MLGACSGAARTFLQAGLWVLSCQCPPLPGHPAPVLAVTLARFTDSAEDIGRECWELLRAARIPFADIRGMGITVRCARCGWTRVAEGGPGPECEFGRGQ